MSQTLKTDIELRRKSNTYHSCVTRILTMPSYEYYSLTHFFILSFEMLSFIKLNLIELKIRNKYLLFYHHERGEIPVALLYTKFDVLKRFENVPV
jgi:hypothetical protein